jgi:hypothetical protein
MLDSVLQLLWLVSSTLMLPVFAREATCWRKTNCTGPLKPAFEGSWSSNIFAPASRTVSPQKVLNSVGNVTGNFYRANNVLRGNGSQIIFDFGMEVGGILSMSYGTSGRARIGMAFTEGKNWIGEWSDSSNGHFQGPDGQLSVFENDTVVYKRFVMPDDKLRGGFRYLTVSLSDAAADSSVLIFNILLELSFQPTWSNLRAYQGYFHSSDDTLNRLWYSGAYTLQTNCISAKSGRQVPMLSQGWANNGTVGHGDTLLVDGAKRDRAVSPGDMGVAVPSIFMSTGDLLSVKNALQVMYNYQVSMIPNFVHNKLTSLKSFDGAFPEAGPPLLQNNSDSKIKFHRNDAIINLL